ncbi:MAG: hypothetical protein ACREQK_11745 [Candidatus Binatia bacterium]
MPTTITDAAAARLRTIVHLGFQQALRRFPDRLHEAHFVFGGCPVRIRIVGREMAGSITLPFSHLRQSEPEQRVPELCIDLWDESETGIRFSVEVQNDNGPFKTMTALSPDGRFVGQRRRNSLTCYNREAGHIIGSVIWRNQLSVYERGKPLDRALLEWHNDRNVQIIHAGLVAWRGQGVLLAGKSGAGKSTTALACFFDGFDFLSEDFVGLQKAPGGSFVGHSIYNSVFLKIDHLKRFPNLVPYVTQGMPHEEKHFVFLSQIVPYRFERDVPIRALVLPRIVDKSNPSFRPASKGEALLALGPSSFLEIPNRGLGVRGLEKIAQLIERVPCFWLETNKDLASIPHRVQEILSAARAL